MALFVSIVVAMTPLPSVTVSPIDRLKRDPTSALLGQPVAGVAFREFARKADLKGGRVDYCWDSDDPDSIDHAIDWDARGLSITVRRNRVDSFIFCNTWAEDGTHAWRGQLPLGILLSDSQNDVDRKLERGEMSLNNAPVPGHANLTETLVSYPRYGMWVTFHRDGMSGRQTIHTLSLWQPEGWDKPRPAAGAIGDE